MLFHSYSSNYITQWIKPDLIFLLWSLLLVLSLSVTHLLISFRFYFFLIQELITLLFLLFLINLYQLSLLFLLIKLALPPFHYWIRPLLIESNKFLLWFLRFYKLPVLPFLLPNRRRRLVLFIGSTFLILTSTNSAIILVVSSSLLFYLIIGLLVPYLFIVYFFLFLYLLCFRKEIVYSSYFVLAIALPPSIFFFIKSCLLSGLGLLTMILPFFVLSLWIYIQQVRLVPNLIGSTLSYSIILFVLLV